MVRGWRCWWTSRRATGWHCVPVPAPRRSGNCSTSTLAPVGGRRAGPSVTPCGSSSRPNRFTWSPRRTSCGASPPASPASPSPVRRTCGARRSMRMPPSPRPATAGGSSSSAPRSPRSCASAATPTERSSCPGNRVGQSAWRSDRDRWSAPMSAAEVIHTDPLAAAVGAVELALAAAPPWRRLLDVATDPAWSEPIAGLGLAPVERAIVLVAVAPEVSRRAAELTAALGADQTDCWPTVDLLVRLLQPADVRSALAPSAALVRRGVVTVHQAAGASSLLATVRPTTLVVEHLLGLPLTAHDAVVRRARRDASALAGTIDDDAAGELRAGVGRGGPLIVLASADAARAAADHIAAPGQRIVETQLAAPDPLIAETHLDAADDRAER